MLRVIISMALLASACAVEQREDRVQTKIITKVVKEYVREPGAQIACPSDDQIKQVAIAASRETYRLIPQSYTTGTCGCPDDTMSNGQPCRHRASTWVLCTPEHVEKLAPKLLHEVRERLPIECRPSQP